MAVASSGKILKMSSSFVVWKTFCTASFGRISTSFPALARIEVKIEKFIGIWGRDGKEDRGNCAGYLGDGGESLNNCALPADQLPLNERGKAWLKFYDELASPVLNDCFPMSIPSVFGVGYAWELSAKVDGVQQYF